MLFMTLASMAVAAPQAVVSLPNRPVPALDLDRYAGQWHEIAHLPMFFQRQCADNITATYGKNPDGTIYVRNACRRKDGAMDHSDGVARGVDGEPGALKVRFAPDWLAWIPWVWADYWVIDLDPGYRWAVVGGPSRKYLWILSRTPAMSRMRFSELLERARQRGYPVDQLIMAGPLD
ncbi:lipocalin family protein [Dyella jejuensis]|uniref:Outer membrane lipoprotein Blc n=1 Tax=Dyella jejuensis TaxID=1432009 RepID=A0ABW8JEH4_9GAMM